MVSCASRLYILYTCPYLPRIVGGHKDLDKLFDKECASILAERGTRKMADGTYQFTRDIKTKTVND